MIFTSVSHDGKEQTYEGFHCAFVNKMEFPEVLAIATLEGEADLWKLDPERIDFALAELRRFYRAEYGHEDVPIAIYHHQSSMIRGVD